MYILYWHNIFLYLWGEARGRVEPAKKSHRIWISAVSVNFCPALKNNFTTLRYAFSMSSPPPRLFPFRFFHFHTFSFSLDNLQNCNSQHNISFSLFLPKFWHSIFFLSHTRILLYLIPLNIHHTPVHSRFFSFTHFTRACKHTYNKPLENHTYTGCRARLYFRSIVDSENKKIFRSFEYRYFRVKSSD